MTDRGVVYLQTIGASVYVHTILMSLESLTLQSGLKQLIILLTGMYCVILNGRKGEGFNSCWYVECMLY